MRRHNAAKKILGCVGVDIGGPNKHFGALYPVVARLERQGKLESLWQEQSPADVGKPRRRVYRLIEKPEEI
jgi:DNA-binding PadR family transcriptional regulator